MWIWGPLCLVIRFSLYEVVSGFDIKKTELGYDSTQHIHNLSGKIEEEAQVLVSQGQELLYSSNELKKEQFIRKQHERMQKEIGTKSPLALRQRKNSRRRINAAKKRVKRQDSTGGVGKFAEAAKVTNLKSFRIYLTMFKNLWSTNYVGGRHPLHKDVPKPACILFKHRVMDFLFPPVGQDRVK